MSSVREVNVNSHWHVMSPASVKLWSFLIVIGCDRRVVCCSRSWSGTHTLSHPCQLKIGVVVSWRARPQSVERILLKQMLLYVYNSDP